MRPPSSELQSVLGMTVAGSLRVEISARKVDWHIAPQSEFSIVRLAIICPVPTKLTPA
jgi:hypothetical protein